MDIERRIVTKMPLTELWTNEEVLDHKRARDLSADAITAILPNITFVVANIGETLKWVREIDKFMFWKQEAKPHLAETGSNIRLEDFPGEYFYRASEWSNGMDERIVLLETTH